VDLGSRSRADLPGQRFGRLIEPDGHGHQAGRIHPPVRVVLDRGRQPGRSAQDADRGEVAEHQVAAVDQARRSGHPDEHHPPGRLGQRQRRSGDPVVIGAVHHRVVRQRRQITGRPVPGGTERPGERAPAPVPGQDVHLGAGGRSEGRGQQPDGARPAHQHPPARGGARGRRGAPGVASRFDQGPGPVVDGVRQPVQARRRDQHLLRQRARPPAHDPDLAAVRADVAPPGPAAPAPPAAEHRVPGDPHAEPAGRNPGPGRGHHAAPLVPRPDREPRLALAEVGQLPGEQLDVGPADPGPPDVDHDLPRPGNRVLDLLDPGRPGPGDHQCAHEHQVPTVATDSSRSGVPGALIRGPVRLGWADAGRAR
jgi:hypothetical protein